MPFQHANDAAMGNLGYARRKLDHYPTPPDVTMALIPFLRMHYPMGEVWEPACGNGAIANVLSANGYNVWASDIYDWGHPNYKPLDFLKTDTQHAAICTNPPYNQAESFIRQALALTKEQRGVVAMLLRHDYDTASGRSDLFTQYPFAMKVTLLWRPRWIPGTTVAPRHNYAWFLFSHRYVGNPVLSYAARP